MFTCAIVEDEPLALERLTRILREVDEAISVLFVARSCEELEEQLRRHSPEVLFLDIHLLDDLVFKVVDELDYEPYIVFTTAYDEYAVRAFEEGAVDYILKPITRERVEKAITRIKKYKKSQSLSQVKVFLRNLRNPPKLAVKFGDDIALVDVDEILYAVADNKDVLLVTKLGEMRYPSSMHSLEEKLVEHGFVRIHKSYLVSLKHVKRVKKWFHGTYVVEMSDGEEIRVSRSYQKAFFEAIGYRSFMEQG